MPGSISKRVFRAAQALGERVPGLPLEHHAEMRHGHVVPVDLVVMHVFLLVRIEVRDDLVAEEIEVHPFVAAAPFRAAEQLAVEIARGGQRVNRDGEMKRLRHGYCLRPPFVARAHGEVGVIGKKAGDSGVEQRADFRVQVAVRRRVARRS